MNYRRIELIFLVAFFCINLYLASILYEANKEKVVAKTKVDQDITTILRDENIRYSFKLSKKQEKGTYLSGEVTDLFAKSSELENEKITNNQGMLVSNLDNPVVLNDKQDELKVVKNLKNNPKVLQFGTDYHYLKEASNSSKVICFAQEFRNLPIFDESGETVFIKENDKENEKIIGYKQQHIQNLQAMGEEQPLINQKDALSTLYNNSKLTKGVTIKWMKLGYVKIYTENNINVYVPAWLVSVNNTSGVNQIEKVNAITNKIMSGNASDLIS